MTMNITPTRTDGVLRRPRDTLFKDASIQAGPFVRSRGQIVMDRAAGQRIENKALGRNVRVALKNRISAIEGLREFSFTHNNEPYQLLFKSSRPHWLFFGLPNGYLGHYDFHSGHSNHLGDEAAVSGLLMSAHKQLNEGL